MEEIPIRRKTKRSLWWVLPLALLGLVAILLFARPRRAPVVDETTTTGAAIHEVSPTAMECADVKIHFAGNASGPSGVAENELAQLTRCLTSDHPTRVSMEGASGPGNNDALARQRAAALRRALEQRGVPTHRTASITTLP